MQQPEQPQRPQKQHCVTFLIVGGGIAGVTCAETIAICCPEESILLLTESSVIKTVVNLAPVARYLHKFSVEERNVADQTSLAPTVVTVVDQLQRIETTKKRAHTRQGTLIDYKYLCICTGGSARLIDAHNSQVIGIRDTDSVIEFQRRLRDAKQVVLVGNGGIASELAYELQNVELHWVVKDNHIASTFVDPGAAHFFQTHNTSTSAEPSTGPVKRLQYSELVPAHGADGGDTRRHGAALGPDWHRTLNLKGGATDTANTPIIHYKSHIEHISGAQPRLNVKLSSGEQLKCDFVVSATGVEPRHDFECDATLALAADGGILINDMMETNVPGIYAAGDVCTVNWEPKTHWFQMRLWTQARQMGAMAGRSMAAAFHGETIYADFCFELFGHVTKLFGYEVILLGRYNGQELGNDYEILLRSTPGKEYIKFVLQNGKLRGAILIGNTELAETCENLILNGIDLTPFGDDILNPDIDIEDYFD